MCPPIYEHDLPLETSATLLGWTSPNGFFILGWIWGITSSFFVGIDSILVSFLLFTFVIGTLSHLLWLTTLVHRYKRPITDARFLGLLANAEERTGQRGIEAWKSTSDKIVLETSRSVLFKVLLVSESAMGDILASPGDGEVLLAGCVTSTRGRVYAVFPLVAGSNLMIMTMSELAILVAPLHEG